MGSTFVVNPMESFNPAGLGLSLMLLSIQQLHLALHDLKELENELGQMQKVDLVVENEHQERIGVKLHKDGIEFITQDHKSATAKETIDRVRQSYSRLLVLQELKKKGYKNVKEEKLPDGSIRLVLEKWQ